MKRIFVVAAIVGVLANCFFSSRLSAQSGKSLPEETDSTNTLDEVVFTANKFPNKTSLTGKILTVITREQLEKSGGKDLSQVLNEQPGVYIGGANSNAGKDKSIYLRGAAIQHTLITIDGVPVYDASGIGSNFDIRNISIDNIERIEILKGSQSTLYGSDAIAGVINIITRKFRAKPLNGQSLISFGSHETLRLNAGINGKNYILDYNLSYSFLQTKGINEVAAPDPNADKDGFLQNNLAINFGVRPNKNILIQPFFRFNDSHGDIDQGAFTDELDFTFREKNYQAGIRNEWMSGKGQLKLIYNYNHLNREYIDDSNHIRPSAFDTYSRGNYKATEHFADAYLQTSLSKKLKWVAGADLRTAAADLEYLSIGSFGPYQTKNSGDSLKQTQAGIYGALTLNVKELTLEAGNRINFHSEYGTVDVFNFNPSLLLNKKIKLFSNLSSGFRGPSLYQLYSEFGNRELNPETALTWEIGSQYYSPDKKFTARAAYFTRRVRDLIFFYTDLTTFKSWYINQDKQKDYGLELETFYIFRKVTIKAFYNFVDGRITTRQNNKDTTFFNLLRRPKHSLGFNFGISIRKRFYFNTHLGIFGERKDAYFDLQTFQNINVILKSYALWDLYMDYGFWNNSLKIFADFRNITNSKYSEVAGFNTAGFTIFGGIRCNL